MKSIARPITTNQTIQKSLFVNHLIPIRSEEHAMKKYWDIKEEYADASHHCFAYVCGENQQHQKYSDAGEPTRTAGYPMLEVLLKQDLTDVLAVTIRYYGGIKLGAGGLARAYAGSVSHSLKEARFVIKTAFLIVRIDIPFDDIGRVEHHLRQDYGLLHTTYDEQVHYYLEIEESQHKKMTTFFRNQTNGNSVVTVLQRIKRYT